MFDKLNGDFWIQSSLNAAVVVAAIELYGIAKSYIRGEEQYYESDPVYSIPPAPHYNPAPPQQHYYQPQYNPAPPPPPYYNPAPPQQYYNPAPQQYYNTGQPQYNTGQPQYNTGQPQHNPAPVPTGLNPNSHYPLDPVTGQFVIRHNQQVVAQ